MMSGTTVGGGGSLTWAPGGCSSSRDRKPSFSRPIGAGHGTLRKGILLICISSRTAIYYLNLRSKHCEESPAGGNNQPSPRRGGSSPFSLAFTEFCERNDQPSPEGGARPPPLGGYRNSLPLPPRGRGRRPKAGRGRGAAGGGTPTLSILLVGFSAPVGEKESFKPVQTI